MDLNIPRNKTQNQRAIVVRRIYYQIVWTIIHLVGYLYPADAQEFQKKDVELFYKKIGNLITCGSCRTHYTANIKKTPPVATDNQTIFNWTVEIHNSVNTALKKGSLSSDEARKIYDEKHKELLRQLTNDLGINLVQMLNSGNLTKNLTIIKNRINRKLKK